MRGIKAPANSCLITPTRKVTIEVGLDELARSFRTFLTEVVGSDPAHAQAAWEQYWPVLKASSKVYTVRVNGRVVVKKHRVISKATRKKVAALKARQARAAQG